MYETQTTLTVIKMNIAGLCAQQIQNNNQLLSIKQTLFGKADSVRIKWRQMWTCYILTI